MSRDLKQKAIRAFTWDISGSYILRGVTFVVSIFLARILDPSDFGVVGIVLALNGFFLLFIDFGFTSAIIQCQEINDIKISSVYYINLALSVAFSLIIISSAPLIAGFFGDFRLVDILRVMTLSLLVGGFTAVQISLFRRNMDFRPLTFAYIIGAAVSGSISVILALRGYGLWSLVWQSIINQAVISISLWLQSTWRPVLKFSLDSVKDLWTYGSDIMLAALVDGLFSRIDILVVGRFFSMADLGFYSRAKSFKNISINLSTSSVSKVLFPAFSALQNEPARLISAYKKSLEVVGSLIAFVCGILFLVAEDMFIILITDKWLPSVSLFRILILTGLFFPVSSVMVNLLKGVGHSRLFLRLEILKKILVLPTFVVAYFYGLHVFLWSVLVVTIFNLFLNAGGVHKAVSIPIVEQLQIPARDFLFLGLLLILLTLIFQHYPFGQ